MPRSFLVALVIVGIALGAVAGLVVTQNRVESQAEDCYGKWTTHIVEIRNDVVSPGRVQASRCDTLTITNLDNVTRKVGFGDHDKHVPYDGISEKVLGTNESVTLTLAKTGAYTFHDHYDESVGGVFEVSKR